MSWLQIVHNPAKQDIIDVLSTSNEKDGSPEADTPPSIRRAPWVNLEEFRKSMHNVMKAINFGSLVGTL